MNRLKQVLLACLLVAAVVAGAAWHFGLGPFRPSPTRSLVNQIWVERAPRDARDLVHHLILLDRDGKRVGVTGRSSRWRVRSEVLVWGLEGDLLRVRFPQEDQRGSFRVRTWRCEGEAPPPFELCLEIRRGDRAARFFSRKAWVVQAPGQHVADAAWLVPALEAAQAATFEELGEGEDTGGAAPLVEGFIGSTPGTK